MKTYKIRSGCSFRVSDTKVKQGGELIDLEDDVAATHADKIEPVDDAEPVQTSEQTDAGGGDGGGHAITD